MISAYMCVFALPQQLKRLSARAKHYWSSVSLFLYPRECSLPTLHEKDTVFIVPYKILILVFASTV